MLTVSGDLSSESEFVAPPAAPNGTTRDFLSLILSSLAHPLSLILSTFSLVLRPHLADAASPFLGLKEEIHEQTKKFGNTHPPSIHTGCDCSFETKISLRELSWELCEVCESHKKVLTHLFRHPPFYSSYLKTIFPFLLTMFLHSFIFCSLEFSSSKLTTFSLPHFITPSISFFSSYATWICCLSSLSFRYFSSSPSSISSFPSLPSPIFIYLLSSSSIKDVNTQFLHWRLKISRIEATGVLFQRGNIFGSFRRGKKGNTFVLSGCETKWREERMKSVLIQITVKLFQQIETVWEIN